MSETETVTATIPENVEATEDASKLRALLATKEAEVAAQSAKVAEYERKDAVSAAGLTLNEDQLTALSAVHSGEWNSDSIKATALKLGFSAPAATEQQIPAEESAALDRLATLSDGTGAPDPMVEANIALDALADLPTEAELFASVRNIYGVEPFEKKRQSLAQTPN